MGYSVHIERHDASGERIPIAAEDWVGAVARVDGVRLMVGDATYTNPSTHEAISIRNDGFDAEVFLEHPGKWMPTFRWATNGSASFTAPADFDQPGSSVRSIAAQLASALGASLIGDEGEIYS